MKKVYLLTIFSCLLVTVSATSANKDNVIEIQPTKKVIHVDRLGLGESTPIRYVLATMPELLGRGSFDENLLNNFSIQIDGRDVGQSRDVVLEQTITAEVQAIEISTSPTVSEQQNGTGGVINIKLRPIEKQGTGGMAILDVATDWDVQPSVLVHYKTDKFMLRSSIRAEYYRPTNYGFSYLDSEDTLMQSYSSTRMSYKQETAKLFMQYNPTKNDELKVNIWESYARTKQRTNTSDGLLRLVETDYGMYRMINRQEQVTSHNEGLTAEGFMGYKHSYSTHKGELKVEARYSYMPRESGTLELQYFPLGIEGSNIWDSIRSDSRSHQLTGEISDKHVVYQKDKDKIDLKYGVNTTWSLGRSYQLERVMRIYPLAQADTTDNGTSAVYASPFAEMNYGHGRWDLQAGVRYQYYHTEKTDLHHTKNYPDSHTYTGNVSLRCEVDSNHHLRLMMARNIRRKVTEEQIAIYPYYNADLNYIFNWENDANRVTTSVSANYIYAQQEKGYTGTLSANAQLIYQHGIFFMAFAGNAYMRTSYRNEYDGRQCWYYNLSLQPVFTFPKEWLLSGKVTYNSQVACMNDLYGDCVYTQLRVSKQIRGWNIHVEVNDIFDYTTYNVFRADNGATVVNMQDIYPRTVKAGFSCTF